ncbi:SAV_2336 N-terminal domain-related protein [Streptomyces roseicoloratus]|uniref:SAV_2336 N-terminal domain-related protein n=1 Tax=Streptomyces roseicoloratus TaxID=2508722 RepID=UPI001009871F|nr:SAV_2336 N-terminal domain-related protein [Streptomyces roseicoloratus]
MTSEARPGRAGDSGAGRLAALANVLAQAGEEPPTGRELAELLWLARQMGVGADRRGTTADPEPREAEVPPDESAPSAFETGHHPAEPPHPEPPFASPRPSPRSAAPRIPLRAPAPYAPRAVPESAAGHAPLLAPAPPMLARPLALQRSLRPLRRTVPSGSGRELDETATADRIASLSAPGSGRRLWLPVLRPRQERRLHLWIVVDSGPTMSMWRPLARELRTAFAQTGAFRTLDVLRLGEDGRLPRRHRERGRTAVLVLSDAMGPQWRDGAAGPRWRGALAALAAEGPVALLQPLPERMWRHTAAPAVPGRFASPAAGVPNTALAFTPYDEPYGGPYAGPRDGTDRGPGTVRVPIPIPVLEPSEVWLGNWAALVASPSGTEVPGAAAFVRPGALPSRPDDDALVPEEADPEELVLRFRALASPEAYRLAAHLAVGSAHLPVMRLVQAAVEERPEPRHLAEVVLSGMLVAEPGGAPGAYDFRPGVRELLLTALPRTALVRTAGLLARVSTEIESRAGLLPGEFRALAETLHARGGERAAGRPFALLSEESVRLLSGPVAPRGDGPPAAAPATRPPVARPPAAVASAGEPPRLDGDRYVVRGRVGGHVIPVWRGYDRYLQREVDLSVYTYSSSDGVAPGVRSTATADFLARGYQVARFFGTWSLRVYDAVSLDGGCCLVTEPAPGRTLRQVIDSAAGPLPAAAAVEIGRRVLTALRDLHEGTGLGHGNLSPDTVFGPEYEEFWRLGAPGLLWPVMEDHGAPERAECYRAPETGRGTPTHEEDLFSLGCVLYELLTGAPPRPGARLPHDRSDLPEPVTHTVANLMSESPRVRRRGADALARGFTDTAAAPPEHSDVTYRLLGPFRVTVRGRDVAGLRDGDDLFLARLLLAYGTDVRTPDMLAVTGGTADDLLERSRRLRGLGLPVEVRDGSWSLPVPEGALDLSRVLVHVAEAREALDRGDRPRARRYLVKALDVWTDEAFGGLRGAWAARERRLLEGWRATLRHDVEVVDAALATRARSAPAGRLLVSSSAGVVPDPHVGELVVLLAEAAFPELAPGHRSGIDLIDSPVPASRPLREVVEWCVRTLPYALAESLPRGVERPVRLTVAVHESDVSPATRAALAGHMPIPRNEPHAEAVVTVVISHELWAGLPRPLRRAFRDTTTTAGGREHVVVVTRPSSDGPAGPTAPPSDDSPFDPVY